MIFRRIIFNALLVGLFSGLVLSAVQIFAVNPIIFQAEAFEIAGHDHASHDHSDQAWSPEDGIERTIFTVVSNVFAGIGFAAIILALMSQLQMKGLTQLNPKKGIIWGIASFLAFFVAPGLGLPPEIPGITAAPVEQRQIWWTLAVIGVGLGLFMLAYAPLKLKIIGAISIASPYLIHIPHHEGPAFTHPDPEAVQTLTSLHQQFIVASGISNLLFWITLGLISAWAVNRWILKESYVAHHP